MNDKKNTARVTNKLLVAYFLENGVKPIDMFLGDNKTIVFVYDRSQTNELMEQYSHIKYN